MHQKCSEKQLSLWQQMGLLFSKREGDLEAFLGRQVWKVDVWLWFWDVGGSGRAGVGPAGVHVFLPERKGLHQVAESGEDTNVQAQGARAALGRRHFCVSGLGREVWVPRMGTRTSPWQCC